MKKMMFPALAAAALFATAANAQQPSPSPAPAPAPAPEPSAQAPAARDTARPAKADSAKGELVKVDSVAKKITIKGADGLEQSFADQWRREVHAPKVKVTGIVAHLFGDRKDGDWSADVIEFDKTGCAMSRTLVPGDTWTQILKDAVGVEV